VYNIVQIARMNVIIKERKRKKGKGERGRG
jgi:hypothetical protein